MFRVEYNVCQKHHINNLLCFVACDDFDLKQVTHSPPTADMSARSDASSSIPNSMANYTAAHVSPRITDPTPRGNTATGPALKYALPLGDDDADSYDLYEF